MFTLIDEGRKVQGPFKRPRRAQPKNTLIWPKKSWNYFFDTRNKFFMDFQDSLWEV